MTATALERARWLRDARSLSVIPLDHPDAPVADDPTQIGKTPTVAWKAFQTARATNDNLAAWFGNGTPRNIGIVTGVLSRVVVVGPDSPEADAWADEHLPPTPMRTRTAKGTHRYYRHPGVPVKTRARVFGDNGPEIDVRGDGGYAVAPGSLHRTGVTYERLGEWPPIDQLPVFDPTWLPFPDKQVEAPAGDSRLADGPVDRDHLIERVRAYLRSVPGAIQGQGGDDYTYVTACKVVRDFGLDPTDALDLLREWNATCAPPWSEQELAAKVEGALKYGTGAIGAKAAEDRPRWSGHTGTRAAETSPGDAEGGERPAIAARDLDLPRVTGQAIAALAHANQPPVLFRYGDGLVRVERDEQHAPILRPLTEDRLRHHLARAAFWYRIGRSGGTEPALPPMPVVRDVLATPGVPLPILRRVVQAPCFDRAGRLHEQPGYSADSGLFYAPAPGFDVPAVPKAPRDADVAAAVSLLRDDLLVNFPFVSDAERAHAIAALLLFFLRELIAGPTPLHLIEKPTPGVGATLLIHALTWPALGRTAAALTEGRDEDEWRKRITAKLAGGPEVVVIDNLRRRLDTASLSSALTADVWEDRILSTSTTLRVPVRCIWLATGNNPGLSHEMTRRTMRIRLDAKVERPWLRTGFKHDPLDAWLRTHRAALVHAALIIGQAWIAAGRPEGSQTMGMFERWARVMGGVLQCARIDGFLGNLVEFYDASDDEHAVWTGLVQAWWDTYRQVPIGVAELWSFVNRTRTSNLARIRSP